MTDLDLKNSRKIIKLIGLPERPETSVLGHQAQAIITSPGSNSIGHQFEHNQSGLGGFAFVMRFEHGDHLDPEGSDVVLASGGAADETFDLMWGVFDVNKALSWYGQSKTTTANFPYWPQIYQFPNGDVLIAMALRDATQIISADGSTVLQSLTASSANTSTVIFKLSSNGTVLDWIKEVKIDLTTPILRAWGFSVSGDESVICLDLQALSNGTSTLDNAVIGYGDFGWSGSGATDAFLNFPAALNDTFQVWQVRAFINPETGAIVHLTMDGPGPTSNIGFYGGPRGPRVQKGTLDATPLSYSSQFGVTLDFDSEGASISMPQGLNTATYTMGWGVSRFSDGQGQFGISHVTPFAVSSGTSAAEAWKAAYVDADDNIYATFHAGDLSAANVYAVERYPTPYSATWDAWEFGQTIFKLNSAGELQWKLRVQNSTATNTDVTQAGIVELANGNIAVYLQINGNTFGQTLTIDAATYNQTVVVPAVVGTMVLIEITKAGVVVDHFVINDDSYFPGVEVAGLVNAVYMGHATARPTGELAGVCLFDNVNSANANLYFSPTLNADIGSDVTNFRFHTLVWLATDLDNPLEPKDYVWVLDSDSAIGNPPRIFAR